MTTSACLNKTRIEKLLLATDFSDTSEAAYQAAIRLCHLFEAKLYIVHVSNQAALPYEQEQATNTPCLDPHESLNKLILKTKLLKIKCDGSIASGIPHEAILGLATSENVDLIVLGTRSIHGIQRLVFGSTAEAVLRRARCPVFTVGPQAAPVLATAQNSPAIVVFATDFDTSTSEALRIAAFFSGAMGAPLHCLNVLPRTFEDVSHKDVVSLLITQALQHLASSDLRTETPPVCAVAYGSEISNTVVNYSKTNHARLIVLGVRRSSLAASHEPAHIAYRIIAEALCPVLTIAFPRDEKTISICDPTAALPERSPAKLASLAKRPL
jgi:nucleotide-binding universal stress UspA family protein